MIEREGHIRLGLCPYYMTAIEILTNGLDTPEYKTLMQTVKAMTTRAHQKVRKEDNFESNIFLEPVENSAAMDRLQLENEKRTKSSPSRPRPSPI